MSFMQHKTMSDKIVDACLYIGLTLFSLSTLFPLYYVIMMSVTPYEEVMRAGGFVLFPNEWTLSAFEQIFSSNRVPNALWLTVKITLVGTFLNLSVTMLIAYPLSKKFVPGRSYILLAIVFTMLFNGGLIPTFLVVKGVGLYNTFWALVIPGMVSAFNMLIMKTYFEHLPAEIEDAARVDGCGEFTTLFKIILPLSTPIMATLGLFYGVQHWNEYFKGIMFITDRELQPMQVVLRSMIQSPNVNEELGMENPVSLNQLPPETVKMATVVVATIPIIAVYPFLQKYFIKGMLLGSIKG